jgi:hypothetical protein
MTNLTMKDLAIKLHTLGVYVDDSGSFVQVHDNFKVDTGHTPLNDYLKSLESKRSQRKKIHKHLAQKH